MLELSLHQLKDPRISTITTTAPEFSLPHTVTDFVPYPGYPSEYPGFTCFAEGPAQLLGALCSVPLVARTQDLYFIHFFHWGGGRGRPKRRPTHAPVRGRKKYPPGTVSAAGEPSQSRLLQLNSSIRFSVGGSVNQAWP